LFIDIPEVNVVYEEIAVKVKEFDDVKKTLDGDIICTINEKMIKSKWSEILAISGNESIIKTIPSFSPNYNFLKTLWPEAKIISQLYRGKNIECIQITSKQANYAYWVVGGEMPQSRWDALIGSWEPSLWNRYLQSVNDKAEEQFYDTDIVNIKGLRNGLGKDIRNDVDVIDTWMWGSGDVKELFVTRLDPNELSKTKVDKIKYKNNQIDKISEIEQFDGINLEIPEMDTKTFLEIMDKDFSFYPRRNKVSKSKEIRTRIEEIEEGEENVIRVR
jgi:hypothetical protein